MGYARKGAKHVVHVVIYQLERASDATKLRNQIKKLAKKFGGKLTPRRKGKRPR